MTTIHVFDPAMCCSTGVCGPSVDPRLALLAADLDWLRAQGVAIERFNLAQQPAAFAADAAVRAVLEAKGDTGLPVIKVNDEIKSVGEYPSRADLATWAGIVTRLPIMLETAPASCCATAPGERSADTAGANGGKCC
jgi:Arsenical resistance operon protein ArsD